MSPVVATTIRALGLLACALAAPAAAGIVLPPGFQSRVYVSGRGFDRGVAGPTQGIPVTTTLAFDRAGHLYLGTGGSRYGQREDAVPLSRIYRIPAGGAWLTPATEAQYFYGPLLRNPEVGVVGARGGLYVTTHDPDRRIGVLYRVRDGRAELLAGGTPRRGQTPVLQQPEGVVVSASGEVYVADREQGLVVRLDPGGRLLDPRHLRVPRARLLAIDEGQLWVAGDGTAERPWQEGLGEIWRVASGGTARRVHEGPHAAGIGVGPTGVLFVAQRHTARVFVLTPDGRQIDFAYFTGEEAPRSLAFAPDSPEARRAGIGGDLFVVTLVRRTWYVNEIVQISGPFASFVRQESRTPGP